MLGKDIKAVLGTITLESMTNGSMSDLWQKLPDHVAGSDWVGEIVDMAQRCSDWISDEESISDGSDLASDYSYRLADSEVEDYYSNINKRVQALSLWAYPELDDEVSELFNGSVNPSLTDLNSNYLYCAMRGLAYQLLSYAYEKAEELEDEKVSA
jgi:hypothetical protein